MGLDEFRSKWRSGRKRDLKVRAGQLIPLVAERLPGSAELITWLPPVALPCPALSCPALPCPALPAALIHPHLPWPLGALGVT